jgi:hypothetical protein
LCHPELVSGSLAFFPLLVEEGCLKGGVVYFPPLLDRRGRHEVTGEVD